MPTRHRSGHECAPKMSFQECELSILRAAIDNVEKKIAEDKVMGPEIKKIMEIVENFLVKKRVICYGGTAINNILPEDAQFYDRRIDIPDYDFFSANALADAKELTDIYYAAGYKDVEAKSGVHAGTYKVFVNFIPVADITFLDKKIFNNLWKETVVVAGVHYASPNWLRMGMYLELARPLGDISRWEKVLTRITLLNKYYPLHAGTDCGSAAAFQRKMENFTEEDAARIYEIVHDTFIQNGVVFFGSFAISLYGEYMTAAQRGLVKKIADFDVLTDKAEIVSESVAANLRAAGFTAARIVRRPPGGEILPEHFEIRVGKDTVAFVYQPEECVNYNVVKIDKKSVKVATIDTILRYYLAFLYTGREYFNKDRLLCMADFLFAVQQKNRVNQRGILRRFTMDCVGKQKTLEDIRAEKAEQFKLLRKDKENPEYEKWFLKYAPGAEDKTSSERRTHARPPTTSAAATPTRRRRRRRRGTRKMNFVWE